MRKIEPPTPHNHAPRSETKNMKRKVQRSSFSPTPFAVFDSHPYPHNHPTGSKVAWITLVSSRRKGPKVPRRGCGHQLFVYERSPRDLPLYFRMCYYGGRWVAGGRLSVRDRIFSQETLTWNIISISSSVLCFALLLSYVSIYLFSVIEGNWMKFIRC